MELCVHVCVCVLGGVFIVACFFMMFTQIFILQMKDQVSKMKDTLYSDSVLRQERLCSSSYPTIVDFILLVAQPQPTTMYNTFNYCHTQEKRIW